MQEAHHLAVAVAVADAGTGAIAPSTAVAIKYSMKTTSHAELASLGELPDYRVCTEDTDPRGWPVIDSEKVALGEVSDLIVDLHGQTVRYLLCTTTGPDSRAVLIPIGFARLDKGQCTVHLDFVTAADLANLPTFTGLPLSEDYTARLEEVLTGATSTASPVPKVIRRNDEARDAS